MNWSRSSVFADLTRLVTPFGISLLVGSSSATSPTPFLQLAGEVPQGSFGVSVAGVRDVNGDGFDDVLIGAPGLSKAYVHFGGPHVDSIPDVVLLDDGLYSAGFGFSVAGAGDVNGDGRPDMAVGEPFGSIGTGRAQLFFGGSTIHSRADVRLSPGFSSASEQFGWFVASAGDLNGDGYGDLLIGAPGHSDYDHYTNPGRAYVLYGAAVPNVTPDAVIEAPAPPGLYGDFGFGFSGATVGDVNGDGEPDLVIAQGNQPNTEAWPPTGAASLYLHPNALGAGPDAKLDSRYWSGFSPYGLPQAVAAAGDLNGDGYDDFLVQGSWLQPMASGGYLIIGGVYAYFGGPNPEDLQSHGLLLRGATFSFGTSVAGGKDLNGDGYPDFIIGGDEKAFVYFGGPDLDSIPAVTLEGVVTGSNFGFSVAEGDVNGDGVADAIVGAPSNPGHVYVYDLSVPLSAHAFVRGGHRTIPLADAPSRICVQVEPVNGDYENGDVDLSSLRMTSTGTGDVSEISALASETTIESDTDRDGIPELAVYFGRSDLLRLFRSVRGRHTVEAALEGRLERGRKFRAPLSLTILGTGKPDGVAASVAPNPLNPQGTLSFSMGQPGSVTVRLYDANGRSVRTVIVAEQFAPGTHGISIDGRDDRGKAFASGVYFFAIETPDGITHGRFVVAK